MTPSSELSESEILKNLGLLRIQSGGFMDEGLRARVSKASSGGDSQSIILNDVTTSMNKQAGKRLQPRRTRRGQPTKNDTTNVNDGGYNRVNDDMTIPTAVTSTLTSMVDVSKDVRNTSISGSTVVILVLCKKFLTARSDQTSSIVGINPCGGDNDILTHESSIVKFVSTNAKSNSVAFPVVEYYVLNNWTKHGLTRTMMNSKGFFFFKFDSSKGLKEMNEYLTVPVWVKLHDVPLQAFLEDVNEDNVLKESITMGIPLFDGSGFHKETVCVEYEWKPPCCVQCKIFGYVYDQCLKNATVVPTIEKMNNDGFQMMVNKRSGKTGPINNNRSGVNVDKTTWQPIKPKPAKAVDIPSSSSAKKGGPQISTSSSNIPTSNPYDLLSQEFDPENYSPPSTNGYSKLVLALHWLPLRVTSMRKINLRLTLIKSVLNALPLYYMPLYKAPAAVLNELESIRRNFFNGSIKEDRKMMLIRWENILASKSKGGLGVSSLYASNRALLFKWIWRLFANFSSIWANLIKAIHGTKGKLDVPNSKISGSIWQELVQEFLSLKAKGIDCFSFIKRKLGNGENTTFWDDLWLGDSVLKTSHPRIFALESRKNISVAEKMNSDSLDASFLSHPTKAETR
ncbi:hypothetical protein Tco_0228135, partial [Tanacetum coccineum]